MTEVLGAAGIDAVPSLREWGKDDWVKLRVIRESVISDALPRSIHTYLEHNWTGPGEGGPSGERLRCLADTHCYARQFIWNGGAISGALRRRTIACSKAKALSVGTS